MFIAPTTHNNIIDCVEFVIGTRLSLEVWTLFGRSQTLLCKQTKKYGWSKVGESCAYWKTKYNYNDMMTNDCRVLYSVNIKATS